MSQPVTIELTLDQLKTVKRLTAACGYLELGMPHRTMTTLENLTDGCDFEGAVRFLRGQALWNLDRREEAVQTLSSALDLLPPEAAQQTWAVLANCYAELGQPERASLAWWAARGCEMPGKEATGSGREGEGE